MDDYERMKRTADNDSHNLFKPPSKVLSWKPVNHSDSRKAAGKKRGAQPGHKGKGLLRSDAEKKIKIGQLEHRIETTDNPAGDCTTRYRLDPEIHAAAEVRIYQDENGKFQIPSDLKASVIYGSDLNAIADFLHSQGAVSFDRITALINSLSGDFVRFSPGTADAFCQPFAETCGDEGKVIEEDLLKLSRDLYGCGSSPVKTDGNITFIRNFRNERSVLYSNSERKDLNPLKEHSSSPVYRNSSS